MELKQLEKIFHACMLTTYEEGVKRGYYPTYFLRMLHEHGGVDTAKRLLATRDIQTGLMKLYELNLLRESMEFYVIQERFKSLFTDDEIAEAKRRLEELRFDFNNT